MAMVEEVKRALAAERKEEKISCFYEMKMMEEGRWKAKAAAEERKARAEGKKA